uniref:Uncharacterized protein n=1 Tax=Anguilla anguilla TaxID=7936 RepID=A0A0E9Q639_ANGAN
MNLKRARRKSTSMPMNGGDSTN